MFLLDFFNDNIPSFCIFTCGKSSRNRYQVWSSRTSFRNLRKSLIRQKKTDPSPVTHMSGDVLGSSPSPWQARLGGWDLSLSSRRVDRTEVGALTLVDTSPVGPEGPPIWGRWVWGRRNWMDNGEHQDRNLLITNYRRRQFLLTIQTIPFPRQPNLFQSKVCVRIGTWIATRPM